MLDQLEYPLEQDKIALQQEGPQTEEVQQAVEQKPEPKQPSEKELNLRYLRERAEAAEQRAAQLEYAMKQAQQTQQPQIQVEDDDFAIDDDDIPVGKQIKKHFKSLKQQLKETQNQLNQLNQKTSIEQAEYKLKNKFKDFDAVVTPENISSLAQSDPDAYRGIMANADIYDRGYLAYQLLNQRKAREQYDDVDKRLQENKAKPKAAANIMPQESQTPLSRVGEYDRREYTPEYRERVLKHLKQVKEFR